LHFDWRAESAAILADSVDGLHDWVSPLPEDLCLLAGGRPWLTSIAHEKDFYLGDGEESAVSRSEGVEADLRHAAATVVNDYGHQMRERRMTAKIEIAGWPDEGGASSELRVSLLRDRELVDFVETFVYQEGRQVASASDIADWLAQCLKEMLLDDAAESGGETSSLSGLRNGSILRREMIFGWNQDFDMPSAMAAMPKDRLEGAVALLPVIDSTPDVASMRSLIPRLERRKRSYVVVDRDVAIDVPTLIELIDDEFFSGFDEVWLYDGATPARGKPEGLQMTSDQAFVEPREGVREWMIDSGCLAALGDGCGLNFATFDEDLAALWR
jgi:hypothetical protein